MAREPGQGFLTGSIVIDDGGVKGDLHDRVWNGPRNDRPVSILDHDARFILLVEKDVIFRRLLEDRFRLKNGCVLASGDGYPSRNFRRLLRQFQDQLQIPFYVLADNDPGGYFLFFLMARGAAGQHSGPRASMAIPGARYVGMRSGDLSRYGLGESVRIKLHEREIQQLKQLKNSPWLESSLQWQQEIDEMLRRGSKLEMEAFYSLSVSYLSDSYLPERFASQDFLNF